MGGSCIFYFLSLWGRGVVRLAHYISGEISPRIRSPSMLLAQDCRDRSSNLFVPVFIYRGSDTNDIL